ncbi:MAG: serine/threonine protein kinase, partial [Longimicrobiales bacterium]|nr:serine/threonine protein kinase [Longimicrobiales bacterium]
MEDQDRLTNALADRYRIEREIGSGGMATVYLAQDLKHDRQVAVKVLDPDLAENLGAERFLREIRTAANLTHPHILPIHDSGEADGFLYYVMPYAKGESLRDRLTKEKQLPVEDAVQITREIADALAYAHREGVIHRDVKPANIMLEEGHAVLADFGVAQAVAEAKDERITRTGTSLGTPAYMSPEQATGEPDLDGRSDQYALGCVLYEMLAGHPPFTGAQVEAVVRQHLVADPPPVTQARTTVPGEVVEVINRALSKSPADRFRTTGEMAAALALTTTPVQPGPRRHSWPVWKSFAPAAIAFVVVVFFGLVVWKPWDGGGGTPAGSARSYAILAEVEGSASEDIRKIVGRLVADAIGESASLMALPGSQIQLGLEAAMKPDTTRITEEVAKELAIRGGLPTVVAVEVDVLGSGYRVAGRVLLAENDSVIARANRTATDDDDLIRVTQEVGLELDEELGQAGGLIQGEWKRTQ